MENAQFPSIDRSSMVWGIDAFATGFTANKFYVFVLNEWIKGPRCIAAAAYASIDFGG